MGAMPLLISRRLASFWGIRDKLDYVFGSCTVKTAFETVTLPLDAFAAEEGFDESQVVSVTFAFDQHRELMLDNIGFTSP